MRKWKALGGLLAMCLIVSTGWGQDGVVQKKLQDLEKRLSEVEQENLELRKQVDGDSLDEAVNALVERYSAATTVNSVANPITMTGEFRFRNTWTLADSAPPAQNELDGSYTDSLIRMGFMYEFTRDVTAFAELQAHWTFGDESSPTNGNQNSPFASPYGYFHGETDLDVALYQGWLEVRNLFNQPQLSSRTGRQEIVLGNQFQFGNADWFNGWTFDGTVWTWDDESFRLVGIAARLTNADRDLNQVPSFTSHDDDELYSIYFTLKTIENHELDIYWIYVNGHSTGGLPPGAGNSVSSLGENLGGGRFGNNAYFHTIGARIGGEFPDIAAGLDWNLEVAYQFGDANGVAAPAPRDVDGLAVEAEVGITFNKDNKFRVYVRFLWTEGPDGSDTGYIPMYPNRHSNSGFRARYGIADLMPMANVISLQGGLHFDPDPAWTLGAGVIYSEADEENTVSLLTSDDTYGWEIDVWGEFRHSENLTFGAGVAVLFPDDEGQALWGLDDDTTFLIYLQARLVF